MADVKLALLVLLFMITVTPITPRCDSSRPTTYPWYNTWHQSFYKYCGPNRFISQWISFYRRCQGDRLFHFGCRQGPATGSYRLSCPWTGYLNAPKQTFSKRCDNHGYIAGIGSTYDPATSDRKFRLRCCSIWGKKPGQGWKQYLKTNCHYTFSFLGATNVHFTVAYGYTLTGVVSYFNSYAKDRKWRFQICKMQN